MAKGEQRGKVLSVLEVLRRRTDEEHLLGVPQLLEELEKKGVSMARKSVYEAIETLRQHGYDVELQRGRGYFLGEREFQLPELKLLVDAVHASRFITVQKSRELIEKLSRYASDYQAIPLQRQVYVAGKARSGNERIYYTIDALHEAIARDEQVSFLYFDYDRNREKVYRRGGGRYTVSPFALLRDNDNYYLVAFDQNSQQLRHYRVDRMEGLERLEAFRQGRRVFEASHPEHYADRHFGMFRGEEVEVHLRCENWMAHVMIDRFGEDVELIPDGEEYFQAVVKVVVSPQFFGWLFGLGKGVEILWPEDVREQMKEALEQQFQMYRSQVAAKEE